MSQTAAMTGKGHAPPRGHAPRKYFDPEPAVVTERDAAEGEGGLSADDRRLRRVAEEAD